VGRSPCTRQSGRRVQQPPQRLRCAVRVTQARTKGGHRVRPQVAVTVAVTQSGSLATTALTGDCSLGAPCLVELGEQEDALTLSTPDGLHDPATSHPLELLQCPPRQPEACHPGCTQELNSQRQRCAGRPAVGLVAGELTSTNMRYSLGSTYVRGKKL